MVVSSSMHQGTTLVELKCICSNTPLMVCISHPQGWSVQLEESGGANHHRTQNA